MRFGRELHMGMRTTEAWRIVGAAAIAVALAGAPGGCSRSPAQPDPFPGSPSGQLLGTWNGTITSDVIGAGAAVLVFNTQIGGNESPLLTGNWSFWFPDGTFSTTGGVAASLDPTRTTLVVVFDRSFVPCPSETGGTAQRAIVADLQIDGLRLRGRYIAGGCPQGTIDVTRR